MLSALTQLLGKCVTQVTGDTHTLVNALSDLCVRVCFEKVRLTKLARVA